MSLEFVEVLPGVLHRDEATVLVGLPEDTEGDEFGKVLGQHGQGHRPGMARMWSNTPTAFRTRR